MNPNLRRTLEWLKKPMEARTPRTIGYALLSAWNFSSGLILVLGGALFIGYYEGRSNGLLNVGPRVQDLMDHPWKAGLFLGLGLLCMVSAFALWEKER